ncbi:MAG: glycosyltransferase [Fervidobacterium sp.]
MKTVIFLVEAMVCGKPVIVTSVGDVPILMNNGVNGIADLLAESIIYLAENPELRNLIGEADVRKMAEYDWDKIAKQYNLLYSKILDA